MIPPSGGMISPFKLRCSTFDVLPRSPLFSDPADCVPSALDPLDHRLAQRSKDLGQRHRTPARWPARAIHAHPELSAERHPIKLDLEGFRATQVLYRNAAVSFHETIENQGRRQNQPCPLSCTPFGLILMLGRYAHATTC